MIEKLCLMICEKGIRGIKRGKPNFENFQKGEPLQNMGVGETKRGKVFRKKGGTKPFKLN